MRRLNRVVLGCGLLLAFSVGPARAQRDDQDLAAIWAQARPYAGESVAGVDCTTLQRKVMCGYQGWFNTPDDGAGRGWAHYQRQGKFEPGACNIDLWPDVSELAAAEKYATPFRHADGSVAHVFSSRNRATVMRHFQWMRDYGLDGVFVQRFAVETLRPRNLDQVNTVLTHCREGANRHGRAYAVMYDLSGLRAGQMERVIDDWKQLVDRMKIGRDPRDKAYLREGARPIVAVWGVGFNDGRQYTLAECETLVRFLKDDPIYGGCVVMLGVPTGWRTLDADSVADKRLHDVVALADIISPWTVGRYASPKGASDHARRRWKPDLEWCATRHKTYLPVVFPGFSWHNMRPASRFDEIPRLKGEFLWTQFVEARRLGATMVYQAMFDELDEGTAIFKCSPAPPVGPSPFVHDASLPSDHYLWLVGQGARLVRGELEPTPNMPPRK